MTMTPTAPSPTLRSSSSTARAGYCQGSDANQRSRRGCARSAAAIDAFDSRAAATLTASPPQ